jgi:hypothetical protein
MLLATGLALAVVWQGAVSRGVGYTIQDLHAEQEELRAQHAIYRAHLSKLKNPGRVRRLVSCLGFNLHEPPIEPAAVAADEQDRISSEPSTVVAADTPPSAP